MRPKYLAAKDLLSILPLSLALGAGMASIQAGSWLIGFLSFSFLFLLSFVLLQLFSRWSNGGRLLAFLIALAFFLRLLLGVVLYVGLPVYGHTDADDRAGYVFTDAHRRDDQAWILATSPYPAIDAFSQQYGSDQYGGLLAFNTLVYRYFSPDAQRPLMLILISAFFAALGVPFLWKAVAQVFGEKVAWAATWIFALYPDSLLLGASAMREPYLLTFTAFTLWGFVHRFFLDTSATTTGGRLSFLKDRSGWIWIAVGLLGMLLVSPAVALVTIIVFVGWLFFMSERREISWRGIAATAGVFILGLLFLSASLNRSGEFLPTSPFHVINDWFQSAVKWDIKTAVLDSGWLQKIFDESPAWIRLPFMAVYGIFQPVLPAALIKPTPLIWKLIYVIRAAGWYALLPILTFSFMAAAKQSARKTRNLLLWLSLITWIWVLLAAIRAGADLWDTPRYRTIFVVWQAILAGYVWVWQRETGNVWLKRIFLMEGVFLLVFLQWYLSRYFHVGGQLPFGLMVVVILGLWGIILGVGLWRDRRNNSAEKLRSSLAEKQSRPVDESRA